MACASNALIVGGGIAGLSAAVALSRIGVSCTVVELADEPLGASLGLSGRAADALDELGIYDACFAEGRPFGLDSTVLSQRDAEGCLISAGPSRPPAWPGAKTAVAIYRPVLLRILKDTAEALGVKVHTGMTTRSIEDDELGSVVTLTNGDQGRYDFVVGADGIGSATRKMLFPEAPKPTYAGQLSLRWMAPGSAIEPEGWYLSSVGRLGFYHLPQDLVYVPAVIDAKERVRVSDDDAVVMLGRLLESYTAPAIVELRNRLTPESTVICRPFEWIFLTEPWHKGRTLLIGDAAHATTAHLGMGGGMAIEDAVVLAQCVAGASTLPDAFDAFMTRRYDRVRTVVENSVALSNLEQEKADPAESAAFISAALQALAQPY